MQGTNKTITFIDFALQFEGTNWKGFDLQFQWFEDFAFEFARELAKVDSIKSQSQLLDRYHSNMFIDSIDKIISETKSNHSHSSRFGQNGSSQSMFQYLLHLKLFY